MVDKCQSLKFKVLVWAGIGLVGKIYNLHNTNNWSKNIQLFKVSGIQLTNSDCLKMYHNLQVFRSFHLQSNYRPNLESTFLPHYPLKDKRREEGREAQGALPKPHQYSYKSCRKVDASWLGKVLDKKGKTPIHLLAGFRRKGLTF